MIKKLLLIISLIFIDSQAYAGTVSFDQLATSSDLTVAKWNADMNTIYQDHNTNILSSNVLDDTLTEADMADDINPRIRTYEGASCEYVDAGLLNTTTVGTLSGPIPTGTAYPRGFRCAKTSTTARTWTASRWTFLDIDQNCNFQFSEVAINGATPSVAANSVRISRVSTDTTQIAAVQDLRVTSCTSGPFENISDATGEATLDDLFNYGRFRISADTGFARGLQISWDGLTTTFSVLQGAAEINDKFRRNTSTTSVPQTADVPTSGTSGGDAAIAASTKYTVYAVADQDAANTMSFTWSANPTTPAGVTNYRKIGNIKTDASSNFVSEDILTFHTINDPEIIAWSIKFDGSTTPLQIGNSFNVSSLADNGVGNYTATIDSDMESGNYVAVCSSSRTTADQTKAQACQVNSTASGTANIRVATPSTDAAGDGAEVNVIATGRKKA